ncbi:MAG: hypothetical protein EOP48_08910 [Sphingobacteriales bacterium]|nr:MAG: hypothetical protein EOP48_08910 [Sphingobacteriales bacterium]
MSQSQEKLKLLLQFIDKIVSQRGNEWFKDELGKKYGVPATEVNFDDFDNDGSIRKIYEYCLKEIIKSQANKFYENFKFSKIKEQLVKDFIRMEHYRRQDDFENFCLAMFQQLECVVNYLTAINEVKSRVVEERNQPVISTYDKFAKRYIKTGSSLGSLLCRQKDSRKIDDLFTKKLDSWYFNNKLRVVLYFFCFNAELKYNTEEFERLYELGNYIYQIRNLNHRGGQATEYQSQIIGKVLPLSQKYYLRFLGFLEEFISSIDASPFTLEVLTRLSNTVVNAEHVNGTKEVLV